MIRELFMFNMVLPVENIIRGFEGYFLGGAEGFHDGGIRGCIGGAAQGFYGGYGVM